MADSLRLRIYTPESELFDGTVRGFQEIIEGKYDDLPEQAFYMVGTIEAAVERGKALAAAA